MRRINNMFRKKRTRSTAWQSKDENQEGETKVKNKDEDNLQTNRNTKKPRRKKDGVKGKMRRRRKSSLFIKF